MLARLLKKLFGGPQPSLAAPLSAPASPTATQRLEANEVFNAGGRPTLTLIDRSHTAAYRNIEFALRRRGRIISLFGASKSGKTTLSLEILKDKSPIEIHAREAKTLAAFWRTASEKLRLPSKSIVGIGALDDQTDTKGISSAFEAGGVVAKGQVSGSWQKADRQVDGRFDIQEFTAAGKGRIIDALLAAGGVVVIDDFHWIPAAVQVEILRDLKPFLNRNGTLILVAVPERAEALLRQDHEMATLCTMVEAPEWDLDEIVAIGREGFKALNVGVDERTLRRLATSSHKNPMLMQDNCYQLCALKNIRERLPSRTQLDVTAIELRSIFNTTAGQYAPKYRRFTESAATTWCTAKGANVNIYTLALLGMRHINFTQEIGRDRLMERISEIIGPAGKMPDKGTLTRALIQISNDMKEELGDNAPIEYDEESGRVYFLDPFFMTYIQWVVAPSVGEPFLV